MTARCRSKWPCKRDAAPGKTMCGPHHDYATKGPKGSWRRRHAASCNALKPLPTTSPHSLADVTCDCCGSTAQAAAVAESLAVRWATSHAAPTGAARSSTCDACQGSFAPAAKGQRVCSFRCAVRLARPTSEDIAVSMPRASSEIRVERIAEALRETRTNIERMLSVGRGHT